MMRTCVQDVTREVVVRATPVAKLEIGVILFLRLVQYCPWAKGGAGRGVPQERERDQAKRRSALEQQG
jgi:hypothetical protein